MQVIEDNAKLIGTWEKHTLEGQQLIGTNAKIWTNHIKARALLAQGKYNEAAALFGGTIEDAYLYNDAKFVIADVNDLPDFDLKGAILTANRTDDVAKIGANLRAKGFNVSNDIIQKVKDHYFTKEHLIPVGNGKFQIGRFARYKQEVKEWEDAANGIFGNIEEFKGLIRHEYVESQLMEAGLPYRSFTGDGEILPFSYGAHDISPIVAPTSTNTGFNQWITRLKRKSKPDLSDNLPELTDKIKEIEGL